MRGRFKSVLRTVLLGSRWAMAPFFLGLIAALVLVLAQFFRELARAFLGFAAMSGPGIMRAVLKLVDLVLIASLVVMIIGAGVEIFMPDAAAPDRGRPEPAGIVDFAGLKLKLFAAISAIAAIDLLESFIDIDLVDKSDVLWEILTLLTFVLSGVLLAATDRLAAGRH